MKLKVYTVWDSKVEAYLQPFFSQSKGAAVRMFEQTVNDKETQFHRYPSDFTLMELGTWDDTTGEFENLKTKTNLGLAAEYIKQNHGELEHIGKTVSRILPEEQGA